MFAQLRDSHGWGWMVHGLGWVLVSDWGLGKVIGRKNVKWQP